MIWEGEALLLTTQKQGDNNLIITLFTKDKGIVKTLIYGGQSKKIQMGNLILARIKSRLEGQLGSCSLLEIIENLNLKFFNNKNKILILKTIIELLSIAIKSEDNYPLLYDITKKYLITLSNKEVLLEDYFHYELQFLAHTGYGLDLTKCAVTGHRQGLYYISPKTGCAVIEEEGRKYHDKLMILPDFSRETIKNSVNINRVFQLCGYFIEKYFLLPNNLEMPYSRELLQNNLLKSADR